MTQAAHPRTRNCPACSALNGLDFQRCIRCNVVLDHAELAAVPPPGDGSMWARTVLFGMTLVVFAGQFVAALLHDHTVPLLGGGNVVDALHFGALLVEPSYVAAEPWRVVSAVYVHFGLLHFGMNMLAFLALARIAEPAVGWARFTFAYVATGAFGFFVTAAVGAVRGSGVMLTAGASGAIFGVMGLVLGWFLRRRDPRWKQFAIQAVFLSLLFGFAVNGADSSIHVDNSAHIGGLLAGIVFGALYAGPRRAPEWMLRAAGVASLVVSVVALVLTQAMPLPRGLEADTSAEAPDSTGDTGH